MKNFNDKSVDNNRASHINYTDLVDNYVLNSTTGQINALGALTAGSGYVPGVYKNVPLTGGTGVGATANITVTGAAGKTVMSLAATPTITPATALGIAGLSAGNTTIGFSATPTVTPNTVLSLVAGQYALTIAIDGGSAETYIVSCVPADTMTTVAAKINTALMGNATCAAVTTGWVITSATTGASSAVVVTIASTLGADLVGAVNTAITATNTNTAVSGASGAYKFKLAIDGGTATDYTVVATGTDTMTTMAALMQAQLGGKATVAAVTTGFTVTSKTAGGSGSTVVWTQPTTGADLIAAIDTALTATPTNTPTTGTGTVTALTLTSKGAGYTALDSLGAAVANLGGTGTSFAQAVTSITAYTATINIPTGINLVGLNSDSPIWVNFTGTAAVPSGNAIGTGSVYNPDLRAVTGLSSFTVASALTTNVVAEWYV